MSLGRRLWNVARAELRDALRGVPGRGRAEPDAPDAQAEPEPRREAPRAPPSGQAARDQDVRRWYANLELPYGASAEEVRAAYRRLMRRYHPDRHHGDENAEKVASELVQGLRRAYEGLLAHLT